MKRLLTALALMLLFALPVCAQTMWNVEVTWIPCDEADLAGYRIYHSTTTPVCVGGEIPDTPLVDIPVADPEAQPDPFLAEIEGVGEGLHFYIVTAYDEAGNESICSGEAALLLDITPPFAVQGFNVSKVTIIMGDTASPVTDVTRPE